MAPVLCSQHLSNEIFSVEKKNTKTASSGQVWWDGYISGIVSFDCSFGNFQKRKLREHSVLNQKKHNQK